MIHCLLVLMAFSHTFAALPAWTALRRGTLPPPAIAAAVSFLLYYDFGIAFELLGFYYDVPYFPSVLEIPWQTQRVVLSLLIVAPWILRGGAWLTGPRGHWDALANVDGTLPHTSSSNASAEGSSLIRNSAPARPWLRSDRRAAFYFAGFAATALPAWYGLTHLMDGGEIWLLRAKVGADLGPLIVVLSLPMHILAFFAATEDARTANGRMFTLYLAFGAVCASLICSQRTLVLFPAILATLSFFRRISLTKATVIAMSCVVAAAAILPLLRGSYSDKRLREDNLVVEIVHNDFSRAGVLATAVDLSRPVGTDILPSPMAGYVYSALFFVPRQLAPFKGRSTAMHFTGFIMGQRPEWLNWGFGVGMLEELILNAGIRFCLLGVFVYGLILGMLSRTEMTQPAVSMPLRIGPMFLCAYHLPSLLLNFGLMWVVCTQLSWLFASTPDSPDDIPLPFGKPRLGLHS